MEIKNKFLPNIWLCLLLDLIGCASFTIPLVGEFSDVVWAPISAFLFYRMFGGRFGRIGAVLNFIEEILPFTDIIPSFTIAWAIRKYFSSKSALPHSSLTNGGRASG
ncbi:MAG: hypothetical protein ABI091_08000 [Ferruginibacter sp.]